MHNHNQGIPDRQIFTFTGTMGLPNFIWANSYAIINLKFLLILGQRDNQNIFGVGHEISIGFVGNIDREPYLGLETFYKIKNIRGYFLDFSLEIRG